MMALAYAQALNPDFLTNLIRQVVGAFFAYPEVMSAIGAMALAALMILTFWFLRGLSRGAANARIAMRSQQLRKQKDHRAMILIAYFDGIGGHNLRRADPPGHRGLFRRFRLPGAGAGRTLSAAPADARSQGQSEKRRRLAVAALEALEKASGDVIVWGVRNPMTGRCDVRMCAAPLYGHTPEMHAIDFNWRPGGNFDGLDQAVAYAAARRARPVLNRRRITSPRSCSRLLMRSTSWWLIRRKA
ncbi:MAG: hypothetical protein WDN76_11685 [Alphaproteobacteria bacterium]